MSQTAISRIWWPWAQAPSGRHLQLSSDPQFVDRVRDVVGLKVSWGWLRRRYLSRWWPTHGKTELLRCGHVTVRRYRYRGAQIPTPWMATG
jgi:hypothetical protein